MAGRDAPVGTQAIQRALALLEAFTSKQRDMALAELAEKTGLARPTAHRILAALESARLIERGHGSSYRLGGGLLARALLALDADGTRRDRRTPFFAGMLKRLESSAIRTWSGFAAPLSYLQHWEPEYFAVRDAAAVFDVSPLYKYEIVGPQAEAAANRIFTRDVRRLRPGRVMYTCWCDDDGFLLQDGNLVRVAADRFRITAAHPSLRWFQDAAAGFDAEIQDATSRWAALAVQGPRSKSVVEEACGETLADLKFFGLRSVSIDGAPVEVSRTGYTGDLGYELWLAPRDAEAVWRRLFEVGERHGLRAAGLNALDLCRLEAGLVLVDVDFLAADHALLARRKSVPHELGLGWTVDLREGNQFVGRGATEELLRQGLKWSLVGVEVEWPEMERLWSAFDLRPQIVGLPPCRQPEPLLVDGRRVGQVTSHGFSPILKRWIGIATVASDHAEEGTELWWETAIEFDRVEARARVRKLPFFDPPRKRANFAAATMSP